MPSIEECPIRAAAWDGKLIQAVMRKDMKSNGEFGKMKVILTTQIDMFFLLPCASWLLASCKFISKTILVLGIISKFAHWIHLSCFTRLI